MWILYILLIILLFKPVVIIVCWAFGTRVTYRRKGKLVGYIRYFKYHKVN